MRIALFSIFLVLLLPPSAFAEKGNLALTIYGARMSPNDWHEFFTDQSDNFVDSYLLAVALARTMTDKADNFSLEVEGQAVRHFKMQNHWEFNLLGIIRWEKFWWDRWLDTSAAFGIGPSWATEEPEIEIENDGETDRFLVYWMTELAVAPFPRHPEVEIITRIHHRSDAFGLVADDGGSNALAIGFKYRF